MSQCCPMDTYDTDSAGDMRAVCSCDGDCDCMCLGCICANWGDDEDPYGDDNDPLSVMPQGVAAEALRNPYYLY